MRAANLRRLMLLSLDVSTSRILRHVRLAWKREGTFIAVLSVALVIARLLFFDGAQYFGFVSVPNHDMYQDAPLFAMSMQSMRLYGDLAWWTPVGDNGFSLYYQQLLSPLAPTSGSIVFVVWSELVWLLSGLGIALPEYVQYLFVTYVVSAGLAIAAFAWFAATLFRRRLVVAMLAAVFALSGIAIWNGAWMYFQEAGSFFFLTAAVVRFARRPTPRGATLLAIAVMLQFASTNYWTAYNLWMGIIVLGAYALVYRLPVHAWLPALRAALSGSPARTALASLAVAALVSWALVIGSAQASQARFYQRTDEPFTVATAAQRVHETRKWTTDMFNPSVQRTLTYYKEEEGAHNARYVGVFLLPCLLIAVVRPWRRREGFLAAIALATLAVCLAPPFLLLAWDASPFLRPIRHLFYFYEQYWQIAIALVAAAGLDTVIAARSSPALRRFVVPALAVATGAAAAVLCAYGLASAHFAVGDVDLEAILTAALITLVFSGALLGFVRCGTQRAAQVLLGGAALIAFTDLSRYYVSASRADAEFTVTRNGYSHVGAPLPPAVRDAFARTWPAPDPAKAFGGGLYDAMPYANSVWPVDLFVRHQRVRDLVEHAPQIAPMRLGGAPATFFLPGAGTAALTLDDPAAPAKPPAVLRGTALAMSPAWTRYSYNDFAFTVATPADGWAVVKQLADPNWRVTVDGRSVRALSADAVEMAIRLPAGNHEVAFDYEPLSRRMYWFAAFALQGFLVAGFLVYREHTPRTQGNSRAVIA